jgi:hypothetical protein
MATAKALSDAGIKAVTAINNLAKNGNFINNSTNGYGSTPDDWTNSNANPVQGGFPTMTKAELIALLGISDGDIEGLWNLNEASGNATDLSSNAYHLTDTNTVLSSDDGLMGKARDFEAGNTEYFTGAAANCVIGGSQTFFCFFKPESIGIAQQMIGRAKSDSDFSAGLFVNASNKVVLGLSGLNTLETVSDVAVEAAKWYLAIGVHDAAADTTTIWVNGIKKVVTGQTNAVNTTAYNMSIGRLGEYAGRYFDGLIQNAGVLSVALTDSQVKKLFAATMYRGQKIRRATTDALITQALPEDLVERLRGKNVSIVARAYQTVASTMQVSIDDGTETASATNATVDAWQNIGISKTISATATAITLKLKHSTTDGNTWFKEVAFYEGSTLVYVWYPSYDDISRFPSLLKLDIPAVTNGYSFEEGRLFSVQPILSGTGGSIGTYAAQYNSTKYSIRGKIVQIIGSFRIANKGSWSGNVLCSLPVKVVTFGTAAYGLGVGYLGIYNSTYSLRATVETSTNSPSAQLRSSFEAAALDWSTVTQYDRLFFNGSYEID